MPKKIRKKATGSNVLAKVQAVARASYLRKRTTTEIIPPDVTRAKAGAWLDLISPITEWAGLKGDQLKHKRDLLRIQQESVLHKIAMRATEQLAQESKRVAPIPNKFLVPFLERASLEEEDSELCKRWADLLVSAATAYDPSMIRFSSVLGEIGPGEAAFLERVTRHPRGALSLNHIEDVPNLFVHGVLPRLIDNSVKPVSDPEKLVRAIIERFEYPGTVWPFVGTDDWDLSHGEWSEKDDAIASNLVSVGILHLLDGIDGQIGEISWYGRAYALTSFGFRFLRACDRKLHNDLEELESLQEM